MSASKKPKPTAEDPPPLPKAAVNKNYTDRRDGLGVYLTHPEKYDNVIEYDDDFVVIRDSYPKASVHLLLLPRKPELSNEHPLKALSEKPEFLEEVKTRVERLKKMAASELRRQYGQYSSADKPYQAALEELMSSADPPPPAEERERLLPPGRDWCKDIVAGVHTHPSMHHMHIHIFSREMHSPRLKHKKHYISFNSPFLVQLNEFPLEEGSKRYHPGDWPSWNMKCWRCGTDFGNKFAALKRHLEEEFEEWKRE